MAQKPNIETIVPVILSKLFLCMCINTHKICISASRKRHDNHSYFPASTLQFATAPYLDLQEINSPENGHPRPISRPSCSVRPKQVNTEYTGYLSFGIRTEPNNTKPNLIVGENKCSPTYSIFLFLLYFYVTIF